MGQRFGPTAPLRRGTLLPPPPDWGAAAQSLGGIWRPPFELPADWGPRDLEAIAREILSLTNAWRQGRRLAPVAAHPDLTRLAAERAAGMALTDWYGEHTDPNPNHPFRLLHEIVGYEYAPAGIAAEALACGLIAGWQRSGERTHLEDPDVTDAGAAVARSIRTGYVYAALWLGRPWSQAVWFEIANRADAAAAYRIGELTFPLPPGGVRGHHRYHPEEVTIFLPGPEAVGPTIRPADGERIAIIRAGGGYQVRRG
jgi:uncharacterized protein YkwD